MLKILSRVSSSIFFLISGYTIDKKMVRRSREKRANTVSIVLECRSR